MAVVTPDQYVEMIDRAKAGKFAYPAVNVSSSQTAIAALQGFTEANSDGIIQVSFGGAEYLSGSTIKDRVAGSIALAEFVHAVSKNYPINVALHTDHCAKEVLPTWVEPLIEWDLENRVKKGLDPLFQSHMWDGSAVPVDENLEIAERLLEKSVEAKKLLEIEVGVVGGEEDGVEANASPTTSSSPPRPRTAKNRPGRALTALTFGNVHGVAGNVRSCASVLLDIRAVGAGRPGRALRPDAAAPPTLEEIQEAVDNGVIKMNIDTDTQYASPAPSSRTCSRTTRAC